MGTKHLGIVLVLLALALPATPAHAGGMVSVCDETHLRAALSGGGTVTFSCSGTITLTAAIVIAADTTIDGSGQSVTISGNNAVRVFYVNSGITLNLTGLIVANGMGFNGGGIYIANRGTLIVSNSTISNNSATSAGGGIYNNYDGTLAVSNSTFFGNTATITGGGAMFNYYGTLTVSNSTFSGNSADTTGGGIVSWHELIVSNSTFSGNSATNPYGYAECGGICGLGTMKNTIVANSTIGGTAGGNCSADITDGGGNLSYPDTTCPGINADPVLGPLQNNGGPTWTMALGEGSAALDAGDDAICAAPPVNNFDQRGIVRPQGLHCDIGAVEQYCPSFVPPGIVGVEDILAIVARWGWTNASPGWDPAYDLNGDNRIDIVDITLVTRTWGATCS